MPNQSISIYRECIGTPLEVLVGIIANALRTINIVPVISSRTKNEATLAKKMRIKNVDVFGIDDIYGIRIIVNSTEEAYQTLALLSRIFPGYVDHDYIQDPKTNKDVPGKSLRLLQFIAYENKMPFEIQITTTIFHQENESLHQQYHNRKYAN